MSTYKVETAALRHNLDCIRKKAGSAVIFAVLKGDGYGLGAENMAKICIEQGVEHFAVTEVSEAGKLRQLGVREILMLRPTELREELERLITMDVILTVGSLDDALTASGIARELGKKARVHLKIDTGMGRYGFLPDESERLLGCYEHLDTLDICGIYTHFHSAFCSKKATRAQLSAFLQVVQDIREAGFEPGMVHCANSSALFRLPETVLDAVRVGSAILGRLSFKTELKKVGYCETAVSHVKWLPKGHTCGYGAAFTAKKPTRIAILPIGWYHGFTTQYGNDVFRFKDNLRMVLSGLKGMLKKRSITVTIGKNKCKTLGHVGMLHTVLDVTDKTVSPEDVARIEINPLRVRGMDIEFV